MIPCVMNLSMLLKHVMDTNLFFDWATISKYSTNRILSIVQRYPVSHQHIEYEAFTAAYAMNNTQIAKVVNDFCF